MVDMFPEVSRPLTESWIRHRLIALPLRIAVRVAHRIFPADGSKHLRSNVGSLVHGWINDLQNVCQFSIWKSIHSFTFLFTTCSAHPKMSIPSLTWTSQSTMHFDEKNDSKLFFKRILFFEV